MNAKNAAISIILSLAPFLTAQGALAKPLKRADMVITGSSCAACLIRIEKKLKARVGIVKAMVSVYKPYSAVVIYDQAKASLRDITEIIRDEKAGTAQVSDVVIDQVPALLMPRK